MGWLTRYDVTREGSATVCFTGYSLEAVSNAMNMLNGVDRLQHALDLNESHFRDRGVSYVIHKVSVRQ